MKLLEKKHSPSDIESKWYKHWIEKKYFSSKESENHYTIVIPPPNVTGKLHMGHVLNNTIQDILIRKARMEGKNACWIPGTDHASIATESKVTKMLEEQGINKKDLTREEFLKYAWEWKEEYGGTIINQLQKLGCSCDWDKTSFTMDEDYSKAVLESFVQLYNKGLIYKGSKLVNWCPKSQTALSDEEVMFKEVNGTLWYIKYAINDSDTFIEIATTRPETMLGDTAIAVNPNDKRYKELIGKTALLPLVGRSIPIIADDMVDPEFGTCCVKITPAHDLNDYEVGIKHNLEMINIMNADSSISDKAPEKYRGMSREAARKQIVLDLKDINHLIKEEDYFHKVGYSERGNVPIEYYLSEQWFLKMEDLAKPASKAVKNNEINFYPNHWVKTYNHWMDNIQDWCISRQLYWGHQIPVWYKKDADRANQDNWFVSTTPPTDLEEALTLLDLPLPQEQELMILLGNISKATGSPLNSEVLEELTHACCGLSESRVRHVAAKALAQRGELSRQDLADVLEEKRLALARSEVLEFCRTDATPADIGGLDALKQWLEQRHRAFSDEARRFGLPLPRGVLLVGPQGTGKSLTARVIAHSWSMPLLRLDVGRLFAGLVGASEARTREMIQRAEAMAPCVLWIDEIDKGFGSDGRSDGGTSQRVLATVLTWMAEKTSSVFVVATANGVDRLPAELLRKGRFDEIL